MTTLKEYFRPVFVALILLAGASYISAAAPAAGTWAPPGPPSAANNVPPPINTGNLDQAKLGGLGVINLFVSNGLVVGNYDKEANGVAVTAPRFCIAGDCKASWKSPKVPGTNIGTAKGYGTFVADDGVTYAVPLYEINEIVRVDTRTITSYYKPNNLPQSPYVDVYDDFRLGPSGVCAAAGYSKGSNGNYSCKQQVVTGSSFDDYTYSPLTSYRHNLNWQSPTADGSRGEGWCPGDYYLEWVDCFK